MLQTQRVTAETLALIKQSILEHLMCQWITITRQGISSCIFQSNTFITVTTIVAFLFIQF